MGGSKVWLIVYPLSTTDAIVFLCDSLTGVVVLVAVGCPIAGLISRQLDRWIIYFLCLKIAKENFVGKCS